MGVTLIDGPSAIYNNTAETDCTENLVQWNLDLTNLYLTKTSIKRTVSIAPVIVKYMKKNLDINLDLTNEFGRSTVTSLNRASTV